MSSRADTGFTLIELLVALMVFSLAALALVRLDSSSVRTSARLDARLLARISLDNALAELISDPVPPSLGQSRITLENAGRRWILRRSVALDAAGVKIDLTVSDDRGTALAAQTIIRAR